jgi:4-hydroxy-tetrahydrodipicolinate synthase
MSASIDTELLRTVHLVPLTAYDTKGRRLDSRLQEEHIARMAEAGMRVFMPAAGTSEFHSLSADEIVEIVRATRKGAGAEAQIFAPLGYQVQHAIEVGTRAMEAGATGIMFMPFAHPYLSNSGARDYYRAVIDAVGAPALIYKKGPIPGDELLLELAGDDNVVGVKYAVNDLHALRKVIVADGGRIEWICGTAERYAPFYMLAGATGFTTGAGNLCPHLSLAMHAAFSAGEYQEGLRLQQILLPIEDYRARSGDSYNISMLKHAMHLLGQNFGAVRPPQRRLSDSERTEINTLMKPILEAEQELAQELSGVGL